MTTRGPGLASVANGAAYASLDRAPLMIIADNYEAGLDHVSHQKIDQAAILRPVVKQESRLSSDDPAGEVDTLLDIASAQPPGAVYLEITGERVRAQAPVSQGRAATPVGDAVPIDAKALDAAGELLSRAARPVIIAGLQARSKLAAEALRHLATKWSCPVLLTYKAKGAVSDSEPHAVGFYIDGAAERPVIEASDLIVLYGFDPIEGPATKWRFKKPIIELTEHKFDRPLVKADVSIVGNIAVAAQRLATFRNAPAYELNELIRMKSDIRAKAASAGENISPQDVVDAAWKALPKDARITVDAGAHMLPVLHLWQTPDPNGTLVSRGLATMGFALPAAIASALVEPERPVIAFTGDGGLMMCASELATAAQNNCRLIVVVFNDSCLTLIEAKQRLRQLPNAGVNLSDVNFASVAKGYGCAGFRVETRDELIPAFAAALAEDRPAVVDVVVDPSAYHQQIIALRG
jgi:acetolactate synthase-1/2/3 large subunit